MVRVFREPSKLVTGAVLRPAFSRQTDFVGGRSGGGSRGQAILGLFHGKSRTGPYCGKGRASEYACCEELWRYSV